MALGDNLVAVWPLNEASGNASDSFGSNTLTDNNSVGSSTGKLGNARSFTAGSSMSLSLADNADLSTGDKLISHYATGRISELGGGVLVPLQTQSFGQAVEARDSVHVICHGSGNNASPQILVFGVE